jgi:AAA15 family ATPase/GTPase
LRDSGHNTTTMIKAFNISNFKSLRNVHLPLGKITLLTGANNSGKSSILYSLLALKNTIANPNQSMDACLTLPFINLGGFQQTVYNKEEDRQIVLEITAATDDIEVSYALGMGKVSSFLKITGIEPYRINAKLDIAFPYPANKEEKFIATTEDFTAYFHWNGILLRVREFAIGKKAILIDTKGNLIEPLLMQLFQQPISDLASIDFVPMRRGFTQPYYAAVPLSSQIITEEQIATLLATDHDLSGKVAFYLEKIVQRSFSVYSPPGISSIYLQTRDKANGFTSDLVNEGLGTNQLVTILAKVLQSNNRFICIDEPEIHLHPTIIDKLVAVLIEMAEKENKQFLISTHSEHFVNAVLKKVVEQQIGHEDVKVYYLDKKGKDTDVELQEINADGQIRGGLKNFYATELDNLKTFFKITG